MKSKPTVLDATRDTMRSFGLTPMFGNPGSTEEPFLKDFPSDFSYILGLQEAVVVAMADGWSRAMHRPVLANLHASAGVGNAMGRVATAWHNKTPLILTAGQQTREMMLQEPLLSNLNATTLPRPYVKLSLETARAQDAAASLTRAHALAVQPPPGPVSLSWPLDDWDKQASIPVQPRKVSILGYGLPAAVGVALAERQLGRRRPVLAVIGDGAFQHCLQALWTAAPHELPVMFVVPQNHEYAIVKSFAALDKTAGLVGLDLPGIDIASLARGSGCTAQQVTTPGEVRDAIREAFGRNGPTVIVAPIDPKIPPLL